MSDSGEVTERALLASGEDLRSDILIKGQHHSGRSGLPEFLDRVQPRAIIASSPRFPENERVKDDWAEMVARTGHQALPSGRDRSRHAALFARALGSDGLTSQAKSFAATADEIGAPAVDEPLLERALRKQRCIVIGDGGEVAEQLRRPPASARSRVRHLSLGAAARSDTRMRLMPCRSSAVTVRRR